MRGGTLDKLESIPGYRVDLSIEEFRRQLRAVGLVVAGQTHELAPTPTPTVTPTPIPPGTPAPTPVP